MSLAIMAAGSSTRYGRLKQLTPVGPAGETLLDFTVYDALQSGVEKVILIVRSEIQELVKSSVSRFERFADISFVLQDSPPAALRTPARPKPWGTGHAVLSAASITNDNLAVVNADDYYGRRTFDRLKRAISKGSAQISIVTHRLDRTLSENGRVARGLCKVGLQGDLLDIEETFDIRWEGSTLVGKNSCSAVSLTGSEPVCMNTWYFTREALTLMHSEWNMFIERHQQLPVDTEFGISYVVKKLLSQQRIHVNVEDTPDECFGLTNPGDERRTIEKLSDLARTGHYPSPLWPRGGESKGLISDARRASDRAQEI